MSELLVAVPQAARESTTSSDWIEELTWSQPEKHNPARRLVLAAVVGATLVTTTPSTPMFRELDRTGPGSFAVPARMVNVEFRDRRESKESPGSTPQLGQVQNLTKAVRDAIDEIVILTGLSKTQALEDLIGVSRQSYYNWLRGTTSISPENTERVLVVRDILRRAEGYSEMLGRTVAEWLLTPHTRDGRSPLQLFKEGQIDIARRAATVQNLVSSSGLPDWIKASSIRHSQRDIDRGRSVIIPEPEQMHLYDEEPEAE